ncbi:MAG: nucleotide pyrophosphohydrolase [Bacillota bacterium]|nr:nucleotide pyrophosphohydrolase [Bacillota bacterium]
MDRIDHLYKEILKFREARDWKQFHTPENLAKSIVIEAGELLEHFQWGDAYEIDELQDELADVLIYSFLLAESVGADIEEIILKKLERNQKRFPVETVKGNSGKYTRLD